ncbi:MAG: hypothetical protein L6V88_03590 [Anaerotruncus sp.]|nr:MAG: hypothetical protein L6V88_03590 [Anaerotruncus sp.]
MMTELIKDEKDVEKRAEFIKVVQNQIDKNAVADINFVEAEQA